MTYIFCALSEFSLSINTWGQEFCLYIEMGEAGRKGRGNKTSTSVLKMPLQALISVGPFLHLLSFSYAAVSKSLGEEPALSTGIIRHFRFRCLCGLKSPWSSLLLSVIPSLHDLPEILYQIAWFVTGPAYVTFFTAYNESIPFYVFWRQRLLWI